MTTTVDKIPFSEMFASVQGEGPNTGIPAIFLRVKGCNLACEYCDTDYAMLRVPKKDWADFSEIKNALVKMLNANPHISHIVLTGGEPSLYESELTKLIMAVNQKTKAIKSIDIETNGTKGFGWDELCKRFKVTICFSPKFQFPKFYKGMFYAGKKKVIVKLPVSSISDAKDQMVKLIDCFEVKNPYEVYLQPIDANIELTKELVKNNNFGCRLSLQVHKLIEVR